MFPFSVDPSHQAWLELPDGRIFWLRERNMIGRQPGNDLVLEDQTLSRQHALVTAAPPGFLITDLQSRNGTSVDGRLLTRPVLLHDGDDVRLGTLALRFRCQRRMILPDATPAAAQTTQRIDQVSTRPCWLLVIDVESYTIAVSGLGGEAALRRLQDWIAGARPPIETHRGQINRYVGDAIFAYWPVDTAKPADVLAALRALEAWRLESPLPFRLVLHHGSALFSRSEHGEEVGGSDVTFVYRMEKIAKRFGSHAMLSSTAASSLGIEERCESYGRSAVDGMDEFFVFYGLPRDLTAR